MRRRLAAALQRAWYGDARWLMPLAPLGWITALIAAYRLSRHLARRVEPAVPVVVVGNITVGGTGKTPLVCELARRAREKGLRVVIISRGYGARPPRHPWQVRPDGTPAESGDEPLFLARRTGVPVIIDPDRRRALDYAVERHAPELVISDDGLQHFRLPRSVEIAVLDGERGLGNGRCIPAGPLREPRARLDQVDYIVVNGGTGQWPGAFSMELVPQDPVRLDSGESVAMAEFVRRFPRVHAVAGIGNPERFFAALHRAGLQVEARAFADHHVFREQDLDFPGSDPVVMTEKDAVKCEAHALSRYWYIPVEAHLSEDFVRELFSRIGDQ